MIQKHLDDLFPSIPEPSPEVLAQAALFVALRGQATTTSAPTPWSSLVSRRFGGDVYERIITLQRDDASGEPITVHIKSTARETFDVTVQTPISSTSLTSIHAQLMSPTTLQTNINNELRQTTVVSQLPSPGVPASTPLNTLERVHVFNGGVKTTFVLPSPKWLLSIGGDILAAGKGVLKAPMPSLVVDVPVKVGEKVEKGQAIVVLESMKTETVLRADVTGVVKAVGCKKGEMVEEGRELVSVEEDVE